MIVNKKRELLTDGIVIASIPIFAYTLKFIFDSGYYRFYDIPIEINSFSISSVLSTVWLAGGLLLAFVFYISTLMPTEKSKDVVTIAVENVLLLFTFVVLLSLLFKGPSALTRTFVVLLLLSVSRLFIVPFFRKNKTLSYTDRVKNDVLSLLKRKKDNFSDYIFHFYLYRVSTLIILLVGTVCIVYNIGFILAENKTSYFVNQSDQSWVAIRFIDNNIIFIQRNGEKITGRFQVLPLNKDGLIVSNDVIGKLHY